MPMLFVTGGRRTGTTLLENVVCSYPGTNPALPEAQLLTRLMHTLRWAESADNYEGFVRSTFPRRADLVSYYSDIVREYARRMRAIYNCAGVTVFKNPEYATVIDELMETVPEARFIVCVRDPRDQVVSEKGVACRASELQGRKGGCDDAASLARLYACYYERLLVVEREQPWRFLFVRYEDMVRDFRSTLARLDDFTGLSGNTFDPDADWPRNVDDHLTTPGHPTYSPLYGHRIVSTSVGRYRDVLSPREVRAVEQVCSTLMDRFGYVDAVLPDAAKTGGSPADEEARLFLESVQYSTDMPTDDLRWVLSRIAALKKLPDLAPEFHDRLEALRRPTRGTLDWMLQRTG